MNRHYADLQHWLSGAPQLAWLHPLLEKSDAVIRTGRHGDLPAWQAALAALPAPECHFDGRAGAPVLGRHVRGTTALEDTLLALHPWRKGPFVIGGVRVDSEWRSNMKWARLAGAFDLHGHRVLDIGCGNGYYGWRMLGAGAACVIGVDPTLVYVMQWLASRHFAGNVNNYVLPLGVEHLPDDAGGFDSVFSMGVLYHRKDPVQHLRRLAGLARPHGRVVLETLVLPNGRGEVLVPAGRYARMRNVWAVPSLQSLLDWIARSGLADPQVLDVSRTTVREQRSTRWMHFDSLRESLDPADENRTVEGFPAPVRAVVLARGPA